MKVQRIVTAAALAALACGPGPAVAPAQAQTAAGGAAAASPRLDAARRARVIDGVIKTLNENYVFPDKAKAMEAAIRERAAKREYDGITDGGALAEKLTADLNAVHQDRHLRVIYHAQPLPGPSAAASAPPLEWEAKLRREWGRRNFGFEEVKRLPGNIGYLDLRIFMDPADAGAAWLGAIHFLASTDALIIDLRNNGGAVSQNMIPLMCSYFFAEPTHLNDIYWRPGNATRQFWTLPVVTGPKYLGKDIYVLTSARTFSGAEEFAYDLQNLKRATIIGETTGGGANPGGTVRVDDHFEVWTPMGRAINPYSKTNWEGVGVKPDVVVPSHDALLVAHRTALEKSLARAKAAKGEDPRWVATLTQAFTASDAALAASREAYANAPLVTFRLKGHEKARQVAVTGGFNYWRRTALKREGDAWVGQVKLVPGRHQYKFVVDGEWMLDPANAEKADDGEGNVNSVVTVTAARK